jgi:hypothetical protein
MCYYEKGQCPESDITDAVDKFAYGDDTPPYYRIRHITAYCDKFDNLVTNMQKWEETATGAVYTERQLCNIVLKKGTVVVVIVWW